MSVEANKTQMQADANARALAEKGFVPSRRFRFPKRKVVWTVERLTTIGGPTVWIECRSEAGSKRTFWDWELERVEFV